jgi:hypothetical protein
MYPAPPGITVLRCCLACGGQLPGQYLDDDQGRADHQAAAGHVPVPGRPLCPVMGVGE